MRQEFQKTENKKVEEEHKRLSEEFEKNKVEIQQQAALDKQELNQREDQLKDLKEQLREKEDEIKKTINKLNEEAKFNEMVIENLNVQEMRLAILKGVYLATMGSKVDFTNDSELVIDLTKDKGKKNYKIYCLPTILMVFKCINFAYEYNSFKFCWKYFQLMKLLNSFHSLL